MWTICSLTVAPKLSQYTMTRCYLNTLQENVLVSQSNCILKYHLEAEGIQVQHCLVSAQQ